ncbi:hypothetical protein VNO77_02526 [Canavalia gladiata]|uniref:Uncharacterized protein n=1 Tax=Canavalia gladiata TaxID=3824 RepID=A0AAN9MTD9_CANGL
MVKSKGIKKKLKERKRVFERETQKGKRGFRGPFSGFRALTSNWNSLYFLKNFSCLKELCLDFSGSTLVTLISSRISWLGLHFCALEFVSTSLEFRYVPLFFVSLGDGFESFLRHV